MPFEYASTKLGQSFLRPSSRVELDYVFVCCKLAAEAVLLLLLLTAEG